MISGLSYGSLRPSLLMQAALDAKRAREAREVAAVMPLIDTAVSQGQLGRHDAWQLRWALTTTCRVQASDVPAVLEAVTRVQAAPLSRPDRSDLTEMLVRGELSVADALGLVQLTLDGYPWYGK